MGNEEDPLSLNLYTYCENEPIMYSDPSGHTLVYGNSIDLANAKNSLGTSGYTYINTEGVTPALLSALITSDCIVVGGTGATGGVGANVNTNGATRLAGTNRTDTSDTISSYANLQNGNTSSPIYIGSGSNVNIVNNGIISSVITGSGSNVNIVNSGTIGNINTGSMSTTSINNSGTIGSITGDTGSQLIIANSGTIYSVTTAPTKESIINVEDTKCFSKVEGPKLFSMVREDGNTIPLNVIYSSIEEARKHDGTVGQFVGIYIKGVLVPCIVVATAEGFVPIAADAAANIAAKAYIASSTFIKGGAEAGAKLGTDFGKMGVLTKNPVIKVDWSMFAEHGLEQMEARGVTMDMVNSIVKNGKALSQNGGNKFAFITQDGVAVVSKEGKLVTAWVKGNFDANMVQIVKKLFGK